MGDVKFVYPVQTFAREVWRKCLGTLDSNQIEMTINECEEAVGEGYAPANVLTALDQYLEDVRNVADI